MEIAAGELKAKCLKPMDQVERTREPVVVTQRSKPVAKLHAYGALGYLKLVKL